MKFRGASFTQKLIIVSSHQYYIERFTDKLPVTLTVLELGEELTIEKEKALETAPLFKNMTRVWVIMGLIILVLGWFSIKMRRKE